MLVISRIIETQSLGLGLGCVDDCKAILYVLGTPDFSLT